MGYELEWLAAPVRVAADLDTRCRDLERRLMLADERLADALAALRLIRARVPADPLATVAAELRLAQARRSRYEVAEAVERVADEFAIDDVWR